MSLYNTKVVFYQEIYTQKLKNIFIKKIVMFRGVNIVLQNLVSGLILDHLQVIYYMGLEELPIK